MKLIIWCIVKKKHPIHHDDETTTVDYSLVKYEFILEDDIKFHDFSLPKNSRIIDIKREENNENTPSK